MSEPMRSQNANAMPEPRVAPFKLHGLLEIHFDAYVGERGKRIYPYSHAAEAASARLKFRGHVQVFSPLTPEQAKSVTNALQEFAEVIQRELGITKPVKKSWIDQMKSRIPSWSQRLAGPVAWCLSRSMDMP